VLLQLLLRWYLRGFEWNFSASKFRSLRDFFVFNWHGKRSVVQDIVVEEWRYHCESIAKYVCSYMYQAIRSGLGWKSWNIWKCTKGSNIFRWNGVKMLTYSLNDDKSTRTNDNLHRDRYFWICQRSEPRVLENPQTKFRHFLCNWGPIENWVIL
jgi:hypothetical protein